MKIIIIALSVLLSFVLWFLFNKTPITGAPPYLVVDDTPTQEDINHYSVLQQWKRPDGPAKVGLQAGHWKNEELPEELKRLSGNTGAFGGGKSEAEVNLTIAEHTAAILRKQGINVDILPTTIPIDYWADVFLAIHADGSLDTTVTGFKVAYPRGDLTGKAQSLVEEIEHAYQEETNLRIDPNITRNMRGYYAFAWWKYDHAVHPMTTAAILETGFLTNPSDQKLLIHNPEKVAIGISNGIINYLQKQKLL